MKRMAAIFFALRAVVLAALAGSHSADAQEPLSADDAAWAAASRLGTTQACQQYLEVFPAGRHAEQALRCLIKSILEATPEAGPVFPQGADVY